MTRILICTNMVQGSIRTYCPIFCKQGKIITRNIINSYPEFDYVWHINDQHTKSDDEFEYMPIHCLAGSYDAHPIEYSFRRNNFTVFNKKRASGVDKLPVKASVEHFIKEGAIFTVGGFLTNHDVYCTAWAIKNIGGTVKVRLDLTGCLSQESKEEAVSRLLASHIEVI